jgi:hypothetical protein
MAQPKPNQAKPKKKRRSRSDPARREAAVRREEARRRAAEERRQEQQAQERRQKLKKTARRLALPTVVGIGVVLAAIFLFTPRKELAGVEKVATTSLAAALGYSLPAEIDEESLPAPVCGTLEELSAEQFYSDLRNGVVVLFHLPGEEAAAALEAVAAGHESHVVVTTNGRLTRPVLAVAWDRRAGFAAATDAGIAAFVDTYRLRGPADADCPLPAD